eukprot:TRINITY_DN84546_c0_g1_i1.p1 TRINITY_DN84546_c0_g1~~TRINITY_DN84546_c0_g1_i1.p1  ORF type:complete len:231 (-),score=47.40 TRINITY_DN84546_c0_g1_i1:54-716(-)
MSRLGAASGTVSRAEYERLQSRLASAEKVLRQQQQQINDMQAAIDSLTPVGLYGGGVGGKVSRDRSRTPRPMASIPAPRQAPARAKQVTGAAFEGTIEDFAISHGLDEKCQEVLFSQPPDVQNYVLSCGKAEGRNPSAMVMGRIAKASSEIAAQESESELPTQVETFIQENGLDEKCSEALRTAAPDAQAYVLSVGPATGGRNASAMVMGRMAKFSRGQV